MVVLDMAIIRTEDTASTSYGVNMLSGLTYIFGFFDRLGGALYF